MANVVRVGFGLLLRVVDWFEDHRKSLNTIPKGMVLNPSADLTYLLTTLLVVAVMPPDTLACLAYGVWII